MAPKDAVKAVFSLVLEATTSDGSGKVYFDDAEVAVIKQSQPITPVYRFYNNKTGAHFYTISESEKNKLLTQYSSVYVYEGIAFYVF